MKTANPFAVVLVTAPDLKTARGLARGAVETRLVACVNLVPGIESHYWWQGKLEQSKEVLLVMKTRKAQLSALEQFVLQRHPYDTPEMLSLPLDRGTAKYLDWLRESTSAQPRRRPEIRNHA